jgi:DnaJ-class molecular chaperone
MNPKKIAEYRKLLNVTKTATLKELKTIYRNSMKEDHPDTIADPVERLAAEERSKNIIEAYHFLVSIAPETQEKNKEIYQKTTWNFTCKIYSPKLWKMIPMVLEPY